MHINLMRLIKNLINNYFLLDKNKNRMEYTKISHQSLMVRNLVMINHQTPAPASMSIFLLFFVSFSSCFSTSRNYGVFTLILYRSSTFFFFFPIIKIKRIAILLIFYFNFKKMSTKL